MSCPFPNYRSHPGERCHLQIPPYISPFSEEPVELQLRKISTKISQLNLSSLELTSDMFLSSETVPIIPPETPMPADNYPAHFFPAAQVPVASSHRIQRSETRPCQNRHAHPYPSKKSLGPSHVLTRVQRAQAPTAAPNPSEGYISPANHPTDFSFGSDFVRCEIGRLFSWLSLWPEEVAGWFAAFRPSRIGWDRCRGQLFR